MKNIFPNYPWNSFYEKEIRERHQFSYPPFQRLMKITLKHKEDDVAQRAANEILKLIKPQMGEKLLGPERPYIPRINNYYLQQFMVRLDKKPESALVKYDIIKRIREKLNEPAFKQVRLSIDVDPS